MPDAPAPVSTVTPAAAPTQSTTGSAPTPTSVAPPEVDPRKAARMRLEDVVRQRTSLAIEQQKLIKLKAELEPKLKTAASVDQIFRDIRENPRAAEEKYAQYGYNRNELTEVLSSAAIEDVRSKTPDGRLDVVEKELQGYRDREKKAREEAEAAGLAKQRDAYVESLVSASKDATKYPLSAKLLHRDVGGELAGYLWKEAEKVFGKNTEKMTLEERDASLPPTPDEILKVVEKRYAEIAKILAEKTEEASDQKPVDKVKAAETRKEERKAEKNVSLVKPTGAIERPKTTLAERRAQMRAKR